MKLFQLIRPNQPTKNLRWFDFLTLTGILWGIFIYRSTSYLWYTIQPMNEGTAIISNTSDSGAAYWSNLDLQLHLLAFALLYLWLRRYDFSQLKIRFSWSVLFWVPVIFAAMGLLADVLYSVTGYYNYFSPEVLERIDWSLGSLFSKFAGLSEIAIAYSLLNGFYEEFFFLGLLTSVEDKYRWQALVFSTLVRISFHTYQGISSALIIGVAIGLFYYFLYKYKVKNLLPFFFVHAIADMFGSSLIYLLVHWG